MDRETAVDRIATIIDHVEADLMPVPVREIWAFGDVAIGVDPVSRLDVYLTKDVLLRSDSDAADAFEAEYGVKGVGSTIRSEWARENPDLVRTSDNGYAAPEKCLAAALIDDSASIHLEVCNASFDENVTQRLRGALARESYDEVLDPRGVCLWMDGQRDEKALTKLRTAAFAMPTLEAALEMLGADDDVASDVARTISNRRATQTGSSVRGDVV